MTIPAIATLSHLDRVALATPPDAPLGLTRQELTTAYTTLVGPPGSGSAFIGDVRLNDHRIVLIPDTWATDLDPTTPPTSALTINEHRAAAHLPPVHDHQKIFTQ